MEWGQGLASHLDEILRFVFDFNVRSMLVALLLLESWRAYCQCDLLGFRVPNMCLLCISEWGLMPTTRTEHGRIKRIR